MTARERKWSTLGDVNCVRLLVESLQTMFQLSAQRKWQTLCSVHSSHSKYLFVPIWGRGHSQTHTEPLDWWRHVHQKSVRATLNLPLLCVCVCVCVCRLLQRCSHWSTLRFKSTTANERGIPELLMLLIQTPLTFCSVGLEGFTDVELETTQYRQISWKLTHTSRYTHNPKQEVSNNNNQFKFQTCRFPMMPLPVRCSL